MTSLVQDRVCAYVADHPDQTAEQIARAVRSRTKTVRDILGLPLFESRARAAWASDKALVYRLRSSRGTAPDGQQRLTHKERVLRLLSDGLPHSHMEGYRLGVMLHSRVADLRKDGHDIRVSRDGDQYLYRLVPSEASVGAPEDGAAATSGGTAAPESATLGVSLDTTGQLTLATPEFRKQQRAA